MIRLENVSKEFTTNQGTVFAVNNVTLSVDKGEIFGVIGYSGAGKSTLVRCLNLLERPTHGNVIIDNIDLTLLSQKALRHERTKIGMIFQQFNLLSSRTVFENVAFPLRYKKVDKNTIDTKVKNLLELVGISDKIYAYPSQLSGGQKQRVAIARALANDPKVLLCDEATSALDPQTTQSILKLLKKVNDELGVTIVIITHEMAIIKEICDRVAVMENGHVVELNSVIEVFANPAAQITKDFIATTSNLSKIVELIEADAEVVRTTDNQQLLRLDFYGEKTQDSIIAYIARNLNVDVSILFGNVEVIQGISLGSLIVSVASNAAGHQKVLDYLKSQNVNVEVLKYATAVE